MSAREDKPRGYFTKLLDVSDDDIDYSEIPPTSRSDWEDAEILFPVSAEKFQAIRQFIRERRQQSSEASGPAAEKLS